MRSNKMWLAALVLPVFIFFGCGEKDNPTQPAPTPAGTWQYTETVDVGGTPTAVNVTFTVAAANTYQAIALLSDGGNTITLHQEQGTWSMSGSNVTFTPSSCMDYDFNLQSLETATCSGASVFVLNGNSMTDGSITMTR